MTDRITFCATLATRDIIIFEADDEFWYQPCFIDQTGTPKDCRVYFQPVQKYGMSEKIEPIDKRHLLCVYPAEAGIERAYKEFTAEYNTYLARELN